MSGMYKKPIDALAKEIHYEPLPGEVRAVIIAAWTRGGLLPRAAIEKMMPKASPVSRAEPPLHAGTGSPLSSSI
jgi:hypothetical protein